MANTQFNPKYIRKVSVINNQGAVQAPNVAIAPDATHVIVRKADDSTAKAPLQDFLFKMFEVNEDGDWVVKTDTEGEPLYYKINPSEHSIWQGWSDYQDIMQKRLIGLYEKQGDGTYKYLGNFLLGLEIDKQAEMTLTDTNNDAEENVGQVIRLYQLGNRDNGDADYRIPLDYFKNLDTDEVVDIVWDDFTEDEAYTPTEKAKELMLQFGEKSFWQALTDNQIELKDKLIGIYDQAGNCVGHFEPTRYNLDVIKKIYGEGFVISETIVDGKISKLIYRGVNNDKDALNLMLDLEKKSVYQQLIELKDFWITLPFEEYNNTASGGNDIANKYDINQLHFAD